MKSKLQIKLLENATDCDNKLDSGMKIFYIHAIKYLSFPDKQSTHWIGSMKSSGYQILKASKDYKSEFGKFKFDFGANQAEIVSEALKNNAGKTFEDLKIEEVKKIFPDQASMINLEKVKAFLKDNRYNDKYLVSIQNFEFR